MSWIIIYLDLLLPTSSSRERKCFKNNSNGDTSTNRFFFEIISGIKSKFAGLFDGVRISNKPIANAYKQFSQQWGWRKTLFELANEDYTKVKEIEQCYVTDVLVYLTYLKHM